MASGNLQVTYNLFSLGSGKKTTRGQFTEVTTPTIVMKEVAAMALAEKQNKGPIFENCTGAMVNDILPDDEANEAFNEIDGNIVGMDWEAKIQYLEAYMPHLNNNKYVALAGEEDDEENDTKSTGAQNDDKITGVSHDDKITGVDSDNKRTESGSTGATDKGNEMTLIEEATAEADRDIAEGNDLLVGTKTETEEARNENVIHTY